MLVYAFFVFAFYLNLHVGIGEMRVHRIKTRTKTPNKRPPYSFYDTHVIIMDEMW